MANQAASLACLCGFLLFPGFEPPTTSGALPAAADAQSLSPHLGDLESAQKKALDRNTPLVIHIILEGEEQNDQYREEVLPNKELIKLSESCVVVIANNGEHPQRTITEKVNRKSRKRTVCSVYQMFDNCTQHRETWDSIYQNYQDDNGELGCPQTVVLTPEGKIAWRHNVRHPPAASEISKAVKDAQKKAGKSLTADGLRAVKGHHIAATNAAKAEDWPTVWSRNQAILELIDVSVWAEDAKTAQANALGKMRARLASLEEQFKPGQVATTWREFSLFAAAIAKTPIAREGTLLRKRFERNKDLKEELAAIKAELAAEELEVEAEALLRKDEERKAMKLFKKILGKKYAGTETAKRVRERFPDLG